MPLDPAIDAILADISKQDGPQLHELPLAQARAVMVDTLPELPEVKVGRVENSVIPDAKSQVPVRIYYPIDNAHAAQGTQPALPIHVFFHGGGWVLGNLETHDAICRELCAGADCIVIAADYRLAPEHPFPQGLEDCYTALCWTYDNAEKLGGRKDAISIGGDSAGANLAAAVTIMARDRGGPKIQFQLLAYPVTDGNMDTQSYQENAEGYLLTKDLMEWFWTQYCSDAEQRNDPLASILQTPDLSGLPKALVLTAQYDPLRDEGEAYAHRLMDAGVAVDLHQMDGLIHGFLSQAGYIKAARSGLTLAVKGLSQAHNQK